MKIRHPMKEITTIVNGAILPIDIHIVLFIFPTSSCSRFVFLLSCTSRISSGSNTRTPHYRLQFYHGGRPASTVFRNVLCGAYTIGYYNRLTLHKYALLCLVFSYGSFSYGIHSVYFMPNRSRYSSSSRGISTYFAGHPPYNSHIFFE